MSAPALALAAATCYSLSQLAVRLGTRRIAPSTGLLLSLYSGTLMLGIAVAIRGIGRPDPRALVVFGLAGLLGPGVARFASITSVSRIGATRTVPIIAACHPLVSVTMGAVLLAEELTVLRVAGIALMLSGIMLAVRAGRSSDQRRPLEVTRWARLSFLVLPFVAGATYGLADYVRKAGLELFADPLAGAFIGITVSALTWTAAMAFSGRAKGLLARITDRDVRWFLLSGVSSAGAQVLLFWALLDGELSVVAPIVSMQPIIVALLVRVFINRIERVGAAVGIAALFAAGGTALLSL
ncbi:EamA family transporter [Egicoccus sp. AB-alg6-2]|uniref:EamA family transporter n=1 Tax=Egicoccus sp. AB-alg6-2 TaxID=3242692 RepID=UPI00359CBAC5